MLIPELEDLIERAESELSASRSRQWYLEIVNQCNASTRQEDLVQATLLKTQALRGLAMQAQRVAERQGFWKDSVASVIRSLRKVDDLWLVERLAVITSELLQDPLAAFDLADQRQHLQRAFETLDSSLARAPSDEAASTLLARKSSLLRCRALMTVSPKQQHITIEESFRCAQKAVDTKPLPGGRLELALSYWALARTAKTDEEYVAHLTAAEHILQESPVRQLEVGRLTLPRFYRLTYRPMDACVEFASLERDVRCLRRFLACVSVYAESVIHLWFQKCPTAAIEPHRANALSLSETAIDAGFKDARNLLNVAFLRAIGGDVPGGQVAIRDLSRNPRSKFWEDVVSLVQDPRASDPATQSFVLGITEGGLLTRLGTFALHFLTDNELAGRLYETAVQADPKDPIALTNLARFQLRYVPTCPAETIERLLQKAQTYSDRRFRWWKAVLDELHPTDGQALLAPKPVIEPTQPRKAPEDLKQVRALFKRAQHLASPQDRGYALENVIYSLARLTFGTASPSYRLSRGPTSQSQIDGYFEHRGDRYRVECKWKDSPIEPSDLVHFLDSLDVAGVSGLVISMSGFKQSTIERAQEHRKTRPILLMDGNEVLSVVNGVINFDEAITIKRLHFDQYSTTYHSVADVQELAPQRPVATGLPLHPK